MTYEVHGTTVKYACARCRQELHSPLDEAGTKQACPYCQQPFISPGEKEKSERDEAARRAREQRAAMAQKPKPDQVAQAARAQQETQLKKQLEYAAEIRAARKADVRPDYPGLRIGAIVLRVVSGLYLAGSAAALVGAFVVLSMTYHDPFIALVVFLWGIGLATVGGLFFALASACDAMRDIARNSFRSQA